MSVLLKTDHAGVVVERHLTSCLREIEVVFNANCLSFCGPLVDGADAAFRDQIEGISKKQSKLVVLLETEGGFIETTERIVNTLRHNFEVVDFIVPDRAMSAGTVLAMSGDDILMDHYSTLGPIDPQVHKPGIGLIPVNGYLRKYDELVRKSAVTGLSDAELAYLIENFNPAELYRFEQDLNLTITLLKDWLTRYKFKDWTMTETQGLTVTKEMKAKRAEEIAAELQKTERWHSHSRGITMETLRNELNLRITDFGNDANANNAIRSYWKVFSAYRLRIGSPTTMSQTCDFLYFD